MRLAGSGAIDYSPMREDVPIVDGNLELSGYAIGVTVDTSKAKSFLLSLGYPSDSDHWVIVRAYDESGNILDDSPPQVVGSGRSGEQFTNYVYSAYRTSVRSHTVSFKVSEQVKKVYVGVGRSIAGTAKVQGFNLYTSENAFVRTGI